MRSRTASSSRRASSGSRPARSSIEPLRSAKSTVTCLRSPTRAAPEVRIFSARCCGVYFCGEAAAAAPSSRFPHSLQKRAPSGFTRPHPAHFTAKILLCRTRSNKIATGASPVDRVVSGRSSQPVPGEFDTLNGRPGPAATRSGLEPARLDPVLDELLTERIAVDAKDLCRPHLIAAGLPEHRTQQRLLDQADHEIVEVGAGVLAEAAHALRELALDDLLEGRVDGDRGRRRDRA